MHYKRMFDDKEHLYAFDLDGREATVQIEKVIAGEVAGDKGRKSKKPIIKFVGKEKKLAINKTNGKTIASLYGTDTDSWPGRWITLFPTTTDFGGETVECIRVRNQVPQGKSSPRSKQGRVTGDQVEQAFKDRGLIDETSKDRIEKIEREVTEESARRKAVAERALGRTFSDHEELSEADQQVVEAALREENAQ